MSLTLSSLVVLVLNWFVKNEGIELAEDEIQSFVQTGLTFLSVFGVWYGRFRQGDITWYGYKTK